MEYAIKTLLDEIELDTKDIKELSDWVRLLREIEERINQILKSARYDRLEETEFGKLVESLSDFHSRVATYVSTTLQRIKETADGLQDLLL